MITEYLMKPGQWELSLVPNTPVAVRSAVGYPFGLIVITTVRLPRDQALTKAGVLAQSIFTGINRRRSNQMHTFGGTGLLAYLGDEQGKGQQCVAAGAGLAATHWSTAIAAEFPVQGITLGSHYTTDTTLINAQPASSINTAFRPYYEPIATEANVEYRITPAGSFMSAGVGIGQRDSGTGIFNNTPTVCIVRGNGGREPGITGVQATSLEVTADYDSATDFVVVNGSGGVTGNASSAAIWADFSGTSQIILGLVQTSSSTSAADCTNLAASLLSQYGGEHREIRVSINEHAIARLMIPGDSIYIFDPETNINNAANQIYFRGQTITPEKVKLLGYTWPVEQGMGVYSIELDNTGATNTVTDISDWVDWETGGDTTLEIGALPRPLAPTMQGGAKIA